MKIANPLYDTIFKESEEILPIIAVYILGFSLKEKSLIIKKKNEYLNQHNEIIKVNDAFVKCLNHDFYAVQIRELPEKPKTQLEKVLSVFEQRFLDEDDSWLKQYSHLIDNDLLRRMLQKLELLATDKKIALEIDQEEKGRIFLEHHDNEWRKELREKDQEIIEKKKALDDKDKALDDKDKALSDKDKALSDKDKALSDKDKALKENEKALNDKNKALKKARKILLASGKSEEEIRLLGLG